jgi:hypothetical protein
MRRIRELIAVVEEAHPKDRFFANIDTTLRASRQARAQYRAYGRALNCLDTQSWAEIKDKAARHFLDHRKGQLKQGFFNQLNEAFAYEYLRRRGHSNVRVLREDGKTKPDIEYWEGRERKYCEVKTIGISEEQLARWREVKAFSGSTYSELSAGFLNKLSSTISGAWHQVASHGKTGLVFLVLLFDDFTLTYYERYRAQIVERLQNHDAPTIYAKIGLLGHRRIHKHSLPRLSNGT